RACSATAAPVDRARRSPGQPLVWSGARHRTSVPARATMSVGCRSPEGPGLRAVARLCFDPYVYARAGVKDRRTLENEVCGTLASCRGPAQRCAGTECARSLSRVARQGADTEVPCRQRFYIILKDGLGAIAPSEPAGGAEGALLHAFGRAGWSRKRHRGAWPAAAAGGTSCRPARRQQVKDVASAV